MKASQSFGLDAKTETGQQFSSKDYKLKIEESI